MKNFIVSRYQAALVLLGFALAMPLVAHGQTTNDWDDLYTSATASITGLSTSQKTLLTAVFGIVMLFIAFKLLKRGGNKA